jgi:hypothetical protein
LQANFLAQIALLPKKILIPLFSWVKRIEVDESFGEVNHAKERVAGWKSMLRVPEF